ncbi:MAG: hypothetical protein N3A63_08250 [Bacteroidetes bacterium]|nr:hypothetical protein [Bacteroidota bacterium]
MCKIILLNVFVIVCSLPAIYAQGLFLERGESALYGSVGFFINKESPGFSLRGGYTYRGVIDGEFQLFKGKKGTMYNTLFVPRVTFYPIKEGDTPTSPTISVSAQYNRYVVREVATAIIPIQQPVVGYITRQVINDITYHYFVGTCAIHRTLGIWHRYYIRPFAECGFGVSTKGWKFLWKVGTTMAKQTQQQTLFVLTPYIQHEPHATTVAVFVGFVFQ